MSWVGYAALFLMFTVIVLLATIQIAKARDELRQKDIAEIQNDGQEIKV